MKANSRYDGDLQMFVESKREPNHEVLTFLRWLGENGKLEHPIAGPSSGDCAVEPSVATPDQAPPTPETAQPATAAKRTSWYAGSGE